MASQRHLRLLLKPKDGSLCYIHIYICLKREREKVLNV